MPKREEMYKFDEQKMFIDPIIMQLPEEIDRERFVVATYNAAGKAGTNMVKFAAALAVLIML